MTHEDWGTGIWGKEFILAAAFAIRNQLYVSRPEVYNLGKKGKRLNLLQFLNQKTHSSILT